MCDWGGGPNEIQNYLEPQHRHEWITVSTRWEERRADGEMHEVYAPGESRTFCATCPAVRDETESK